MTNPIEENLRYLLERALLEIARTNARVATLEREIQELRVLSRGEYV